MTYEEAHKSPLPAAYVTFQFGGNDFNNHQEFTVGDGVQSNGKIRSKRSNGEEYYYNRPLHPNTNYRVFLRAFVTEVFWSTDLSPPKIMQHYNTKDERRIFYLKAQYILNVVVTSRCFHSKLRLCHAPFPPPHPHPRFQVFCTCLNPFCSRNFAYDVFMGCLCRRCIPQAVS